eukprot:m.1589971 g.1589971  ORF g.1589971 m.1589971 type:complete len:300 (+) comp25335_c0_seq11:5093-5992(+)
MLHDTRILTLPHTHVNLPRARCALMSSQLAWSPLISHHRFYFSRRPGLAGNSISVRIQYPSFVPSFHVPLPLNFQGPVQPCVALRLGVAARRQQAHREQHRERRCGHEQRDILDPIRPCAVFFHQFVISHFLLAKRPTSRWTPSAQVLQGDVDALCGVENGPISAFSRQRIPAQRCIRLQTGVKTRTAARGRQGSCVALDKSLENDKAVVPFWTHVGTRALDVGDNIAERQPNHDDGAQHEDPEHVLQTLPCRKRRLVWTAERHGGPFLNVEDEQCAQNAEDRQKWAEIHADPDQGLGV